MGFLGTQELVLVLLAMTLLFGVKRIPEVARALGGSIHEFIDAAKGAKEAKSIIDMKVSEIK